MAHRPATLNSDTGCEYAGHWHISRLKDIKGNKQYWNQDAITYGGWDWTNNGGLWAAYQTLYP